MSQAPLLSASTGGRKYCVLAMWRLRYDSYQRLKTSSVIRNPVVQTTERHVKILARSIVATFTRHRSLRHPTSDLARHPRRAGDRGMDDTISQST